MPRTLDLAALKTFIAIADTGGVTRAARRLNMTQSAVSMQLKRLEEAVHQPLFERGGKGMITTPQGDQLLSYARRMLDLNDEAMARMTGVAYEGSLILGAPSDVVYPHIPAILRTFARDFPRVRVTLQSSYTHALKAQFAQGEVDIILTTESTVDPNGSVLQDAPLVWVGAHNGNAWRQRPLPLAFEQNCMFRPIVNIALDEASIPWTLAVESMSTRTIEASVSADFAVHAALDFTVPDELTVIDHGGALPELPSMAVGLYVTEGRNRALAQKLAAVVQERWVNPQMADVVPLAAE